VHGAAAPSLHSACEGPEAGWYRGMDALVQVGEGAEGGGVLRPTLVELQTAVMMDGWSAP
jgi:hypothetical protein